MRTARFPVLDLMLRVRGCKRVRSDESAAWRSSFHQRGKARVRMDKRRVQQGKDRVLDIGDGDGASVSRRRDARRARGVATAGRQGGRGRAWARRHVDTQTPAVRPAASEKRSKFSLSFYMSFQ